MSNIGKVLRDEIQRLTRKEMKSSMVDFKKQIAALRKTITEQKRTIEALRKTQSKILKEKCLPDVRPAAADAEEEASSVKIRPTSKMIRNLRSRLGLTQAELAELLGVSGQSVYQWERKDGPLKLRSRTKEALLEVRGLGVREVRSRLQGSAN